VKNKPPKRSKGDIAHSVAKAALGSIPVAGNAAAEFFQLLVTPPLERRRDEWISEIDARLKKLETEGITLSSLQANKQFISTLLQATQMALRTHQQEKLEALRNAVVNSARPGAEESEQQMFLNFVDIFTGWHIQILRLFRTPPTVSTILSGPLSAVIERQFPELRGRRDFYDQVWRDLFFRGLVNTEELQVMMTAHGLTQQRTTPLGNRFLDFIGARRGH
jgi:hypothetical protein